MAGIRVFADTDPISNLRVQQRYPWNGLVDITFTLDGEVGQMYDISLAATTTTAGGGNVTLPVTTVYQQGKTILDGLVVSNGVQHLIWDAGTDAPKVKYDDVALEVTAVTYELVDGFPNKQYVIIDLTNGEVVGLNSVPSGGWTDICKTRKLVLRRIPAGSFIIGPTQSESYRVTLTKDFYIGIFEVTQMQWELIMGTRPSYFSNPKCYTTRPVEQVSYDMIRGTTEGAKFPISSEVDSTSFLGELRAKTGIDFDLPTEAQWEYACRAGTSSEYNNGRSDTDGFAWRSSIMDQLGRYYYNNAFSAAYPDPSWDTSSGTAAVGSYTPNAWGLYDMHGNVDEWCLDWNLGSRNGKSYGTDPQGNHTGYNRTSRGGSWNSLAGSCSQLNHGAAHPTSASKVDGFRLAKTLSK